MDEVKQIFIDNFQPLFQPLWESITFWRSLALIAIATITAVIIFRRKIHDYFHIQEHDVHDSRIFIGANKIVDEASLSAFLNRLDSDHSYEYPRMVIMSRYIEFLSQHSNQSIYADINKATALLTKSIFDLLEYIGLHFFVMKGSASADRFCLYPDLNPDRGGDRSISDGNKYDKHADELARKTRKVREQFKAYRAIIKMRLLK